MPYKHTKEWFYGSEIHKTILNHLDTNKQNNILEIGCYEGLSSVFFADNLLRDTNSSMICVDPFLTINCKANVTKKVEDNFDFNISNCHYPEKITVRKITSDDFFKTNDKYFNFIYIDGCHEPDFITRDMNNSFKYLLKDGIMWMDDYWGGDGIQIRTAMDSWLNENKDKFILIHKGYQIAIKKLI